ncbi:E3 ubiquitin ligase SCF complex subunit SKP1/ASK1 family protein [Rhynchospora pubera]|uniref:E3 ubiquitin ligase SCF complex subunit SKP1/ASK1 family protein n=1 Tax=Rhynchospora pubera TaxID=906938 RepID=A0AAV8BYN0_9POAL|nr:E3 ubiquitin ligase SCF complex subunit SKP1/ASK1 family protein [Rhynchospora pubera]
MKFLPRQLQRCMIAYCENHASATDASKTQAETTSKVFSEEDMDNWYRQFIDMDPMMLLDLCRAACFLQIKELVDITAHKIADILKGNSVEEIRQTFNILNDFSPEEEEEIRRKHHWAFH